MSGPCQLSVSRPIRVGISRCLLGDKVRYDGGHQHDRYITQTLGRYLEFVPVCPEVECGLPVPREAMRLVDDPDNPGQPRLMTQTSGVDHTARMTEWTARRVQELAAENLVGFIFKAKSPSSGMERVKVYPAVKGAMPRHDGVGLFARAFMERFPLLPVEDDGRLHDARLREHFIERLFALDAWRQFLGAEPTLGRLVEFQANHKLQLLAHSPKLARELGNLVAHAHGRDFAAVLDDYGQTFQRAMAAKVSPKRHVNVLHHVLGHFKKDLTADEKQEAVELIASYAAGDVPLVVPVTLLNHYVRRYAKAWLCHQTYLHPHPFDLRLRNLL